MENTRKQISEELARLGIYNKRGKKYESGSFDRICKKLGIEGSKQVYTYYDPKEMKEKTSLEWTYTDEDKKRIMQFCMDQKEKPQRRKRKPDDRDKLLLKVEQLKIENRILKKQLEQQESKNEDIATELEKLRNEINGIFEEIKNEIGYCYFISKEDVEKIKKVHQKIKKPWWRRNKC